jgi:hypothetical protein
VQLKAITTAGLRLEAMRRHNEVLQNSLDHDDLRIAWMGFVEAMSAIYSNFEQGAKGDNKSGYWFGLMKSQRYEDPLLHYMRFVRNSTEHSIESVADNSLTGARFRVTNAQDGEINIALNADGSLGQVMNSRGVEYVAHTLPSLALLTVRNRKTGQSVDPPSEHLGEKISAGNDVRAVAALALTYMETKFEEAAAFVT